MITIREDKLKKILKEEVDRAVNKILLRLKLEQLETVSEEEQKEIEEMFGRKPPVLDEKSLFEKEPL